MEKFHSKYHNKKYPLNGYLYTILIGVGIIFFINFIDKIGLIINLVLFSALLIYFLGDYLLTNYVDEIQIDKSSISIFKKSKSGSNLEKIEVEFSHTYFSFEYENTSKSATIKVLKIFYKEKILVSLNYGSDWSKKEIDNLIDRLKANGIKGKISKSEKSFSNEFEYFN